jgi:hypothetical protein
VFFIGAPLFYTEELRARLRELENKLTAMEERFSDSGGEKRACPTWQNV